MGEATYVLCWYRTIQFSHKIDLSAFPQSLVKMSPAGIATKAFKTLGGMSRDPDFTNSGNINMIKQPPADVQLQMLFRSV